MCNSYPMYYPKINLASCTSEPLFEEILKSMELELVPSQQSRYLKRTGERLFFLVILSPNDMIYFKFALRLLILRNVSTIHVFSLLLYQHAVIERTDSWKIDKFSFLYYCMHMRKIFIWLFLWLTSFYRVNIDSNCPHIEKLQHCHFRVSYSSGLGLDFKYSF